MNSKHIRWIASLLALLITLLSGGCEKSAERIPAKETFIKFRKDLDQIKALEEKKIRPAALIQISDEDDYTRYLTGNGRETVDDQVRPYPNREVLKQYQAIIRKVGIHCIDFSTEGTFRVVFMNGEFNPPEEDGLIYQPDALAIRSPKYPDNVEFLGDGWYSYDKRKGKKQ